MLRTLRFFEALVGLGQPAHLRTGRDLGLAADHEPEVVAVGVERVRERRGLGQVRDRLRDLTAHAPGGVRPHGLSASPLRFAVRVPSSLDVLHRPGPDTRARCLVEVCERVSPLHPRDLFPKVVGFVQTDHGRGPVDHERREVKERTRHKVVRELRGLEL